MLDRVDDESRRSLLEACALGLTRRVAGHRSFPICMAVPPNVVAIGPYRSKFPDRPCYSITYISVVSV